MLDRKPHPSFPVHGLKECEGGGMMGVTPQHPAQHRSRYSAGQVTEVKDGKGREGVLLQLNR